MVSSDNIACNNWIVKSILKGTQIEVKYTQTEEKCAKKLFLCYNSRVRFRFEIRKHVKKIKRVENCYEKERIMEKIW